jgi:hypothetical protein
MDLAERCCQANSDAQKASQVERLPLDPLKDPIQWLTARVLKYKDCPPLVTSERQRPSRPCGLEFGCERVFVLEPPETLRRRLFGSECYCQDRRWVAVLPAAAKSKVRTFPEGLQHVPGRLCNGGHPRRHGCATPFFILTRVEEDVNANDASMFIRADKPSWERWRRQGRGRGRGMERKSDKAPRERRLGSLKNGNPSGDFTKAARCGAKNRRGLPCQQPAIRRLLRTIYAAGLYSCAFFRAWRFAST